jgi:hypothetical protein
MSSAELFSPVTFCGRTFRAEQLELMRQLARDYAALGGTEIARTILELLEWKRPNGGLNFGAFEK